MGTVPSDQKQHGTQDCYYSLTGEYITDLSPVFMVLSHTVHVTCDAGAAVGRVWFRLQSKLVDSISLSWYTKYAENNVHWQTHVTIDTNTHTVRSCDHDRH